MRAKAILVSLLAGFVVLASQVVSAKTKKKQIYLAGTFPISGSEGWQGGQACLPAALLALEDVNRKVVLPRYCFPLFSVLKSGRPVAQLPPGHDQQGRPVRQWTRSLQALRDALSGEKPEGDDAISRLAKCGAACYRCLRANNYD